MTGPCAITTCGSWLRRLTAPADSLPRVHPTAFDSAWFCCKSFFCRKQHGQQQLKPASAYPKRHRNTIQDRTWRLQPESKPHTQASRSTQAAHRRPKPECNNLTTRVFAVCALHRASCTSAVEIAVGSECLGRLHLPRQAHSDARYSEVSQASTAAAGITAARAAQSFEAAASAAQSTRLFRATSQFHCMCPEATSRNSLLAHRLHNSSCSSLHSTPQHQGSQQQRPPSPDGEFAGQPSGNRFDGNIMSLCGYKPPLPWRCSLAAVRIGAGTAALPAACTGNLQQAKQHQCHRRGSPRWTIDIAIGPKHA